MYVCSDIAEKIIRNYSIKKQKNVYRRESEEKVKTFLKNIGFKEDIVYLNNEDSIEEIIKTTGSGENISLQHSVLSYEIDIYFLGHELAIEIDELGHKDRDINKEIAIQQEYSGCQFIRINPAKNFFNIFVEISKIFNHIK